jgi:hypothetical protein
MTWETRYSEASSGIKGDSYWRCTECDRLVANRFDHDAIAHPDDGS